MSYDFRRRKKDTPSKKTHGKSRSRPPRPSHLPADKMPKLKGRVEMRGLHASTLLAVIHRLPRLFLLCPRGGNMTAADVRRRHGRSHTHTHTNPPAPPPRRKHTAHPLFTDARRCRNTDVHSFARHQKAAKSRGRGETLRLRSVV